MSNVLTGDFEAVLEVSGRTFDRLFASMHQNGFVDPERPSLPHVAYFRLGIGGGGVNDPRGSVSAQIGTPHLVLIDGATDRFGIELGLRARYRPDPGSAPLADVIHGTVRAQFRLQDIDSHCKGWHDIADQYLWLTLVDGSVSFDGTVHRDQTGAATVFDQDAVKAVITQQLALLFETTFAPTPQPVADRFRHGLHCLAPASSNESAVAIPVALSGDVPVGDPTSIEQLFIDQSDFALAVSADYILGPVAAQLHGLEGLQSNFHISSDAGLAGGLEIDYHVRLDAIGAQWIGPLVPSLVPAGLQGVIAPGLGAVRIDFAGSGWASSLSMSGIYNLSGVSIGDLDMTFTGEQLLMLSFDPGGEQILISAFGPPSVTVNYNGPYADQVIPIFQQNIAAQVQANLDGALAQARKQLSVLTDQSQKGPLLDQFRRFDAAATARFDVAVFAPQGVIIRGTIGLSPRRAPQVTFAKTADGDGFTAVESWIPGGRIDAFDWSWRWFTNGLQAPAGPPGSEESKDDFLLRRTYQAATKYQMLIGEQPLPGINGNGSVCLTINGVHVDASTGRLVPTASVITCEQFTFDIHVPIQLAPLVRLFGPSGRSETSAFRELGMVQVAAPVHTSNTLAVAAGQKWDPGLISILAAGLKGCQRSGAGLLVVLLFEDGAFRNGGRELGAQLEAIEGRLGAPVMATEDIQQGWSIALGMPAQNKGPCWRLLRPDGVLAWVHDGRLKAADLTSALDKWLVRSKPALPGPVRPGVGIGDRVPIQLGGPLCPPVPLARPGSAGSRIIFVRQEHSSALGALKPAQGSLRVRKPRDLFVAAVVAGANTGDADRLQAELGVNFPVFPDPNGDLSRRAGVRLWPTTLTLDHLGRLSDFQMGVTPTEGSP